MDRNNTRLQLVSVQVKVIKDHIQFRLVIRLVKTRRMNLQLQLVIRQVNIDKEEVL